MTLLDAQPPRPRSKLRRFGAFILGIILAAGGFLAYEFRYYPEERAVERFLTTLEKGDYQQGYKLWQPAPSYSFQDFLHDWGEHGDYGKIRDFQILDAKSKGSNNVIVTVRINRVDPPLDLVVDRANKGLAYSAF